MKYSRRASALSPRATIVGMVVVLLLLIALVLRLFFPGTLGFLALPFFQLGNTIAGGTNALVSVRYKAEEQTRLVEENKALTQENVTLKAQIQDMGAREETGVIAGVLSRPPLSPYDTLIVSAGTRDGVQKGARVFFGSIPIGTVVEVGEASSHVLLYSASGRESEGWVGEERLPITLIGRGVGTFAATVSRDMPVVAGDVIYLPGPGPYAVGVVREVENHPSSPTAKIMIAPYANPFSITYVRIVSE